MPISTPKRINRRRAKSLFSKADLNTAAEIIAEVRDQRNRASLAAGSDASAREASDDKVRKMLGRRLSRALPGFAEFQSIKKAHLVGHAKAGATFSGPADSSTHVRWGDLLATDDFSSEQFGPPFQIFDFHHVDAQHLISNDQSFVSHSQGTMIAYDVLREMSDLDVPLFVTVGSPLGIQEVQDRLRKFTKQKHLAVPPCVKRWINV